MQKAYTEYFDEAIAGMGGGDPYPLVMAMALEAGECEFGYGVIGGTDERHIVVPSAAVLVGAFKGIAMFTHSQEKGYPVGSTNPKFKVGDQVPILKKGWIVVKPITVVALGDPVFLQHTTNGANLAGTFRNAAEGVNSVDISTVAKWVTGNNAVAGGLVKLDILVMGG